MQFIWAIIFSRVERDLAGNFTTSTYQPQVILHLGPYQGLASLVGPFYFAAEVLEYFL